MGYKNFNLQVTFYVMLIALTSTAFVWTVDKQYLLVTNLSLGILWVFEVIFLINFVKRTNRDLALFMESIKFDDDTLTFKSYGDNSFKPLYAQFNRIIDELRKAKTEKEIEHQYFTNTVKHVPVGLISFDTSGRVEIFNGAASDLLNLQILRNIKELSRVSLGFAELLTSMEAGHHEVFRIRINNEMLALYVKASEFKLQDNHIKLISLQNITAELEEGEIEAWQKLIRVLTHEIINSVSPITLLSSSLIQSLEKEGKQIEIEELNKQTITTSIESLKAIQKRSNGLKRFVANYKSIAKIPDPKFSLISVREILEQVHILLKRDLEARKIKFSFKVLPKGLELTADEKLIEQVLINLVKNAMQALSQTNNPKIELVSYETASQVYIEVRDNGPGIADEDIDNIFLPFYTTREEGSGIGLNLSKQIMRVHKGKLNVDSHPGRTIFQMVF